MSVLIYPQGATTSTADVSQMGALLRIYRDDGMFMVRDCLGTRYGHGATLAGALVEYARQVDDLLTFRGPSGPPLSVEIDRYRRAFGAPS